ncbi:MAG TPA: ABC transporter permease, partial [Levilinea sp.]|nr:ABC transporter permease [Levilinea sp.]
MAANGTFHRRFEVVSPTRQRVMGIIFMVFALAMIFFFAADVESGDRTSFGLSRGGAVTQLTPIDVPAQSTLYILAVVSAILGGIQLSRGFKKHTNLALAFVVGIFIFGFLVWAAAGRSLNLTGLLVTTLSRAVPLTLGAMSGILCERAGIVNIAIEGMMLSAAFAATVSASISGSLWVGVFVGVGTGALMGLLLGVLSIRYKTNQIIAGTVINILATGLTSYLGARFLRINPNWNNPGIFRPVSIPLLYDIPVIGPLLFENNMFVYGMFLMLIGLHFGLFYTRWGLRHRAVGEHPKAADTLGINVFRTRYMAVILGGAMAGFAGSYFT